MQFLEYTKKVILIQNTFRRYRNRSNLDEDRVIIIKECDEHSEYSFGKKDIDRSEFRHRESIVSYSVKNKSYYSNTIHSIDLEIDESNLYLYRNA
jgi:hypothetical protein